MVLLPDGRAARPTDPLTLDSPTHRPPTTRPPNGPNDRPIVVWQAAGLAKARLKREACWQFPGSAKDLADTPAMMLNWVLGGAPYVGCDIGGFNGETNGPHLTRWLQVWTRLWDGVGARLSVFLGVRPQDRQEDRPQSDHYTQTSEVKATVWGAATRRRSDPMGGDPVAGGPMGCSEPMCCGSNRCLPDDDVDRSGRRFWFHILRGVWDGGRVGTPPCHREDCPAPPG